MKTIKELIQPAKWSASVTSLPHSRSAKNEVYKTKGRTGQKIITTRVGGELLVIYLNNYNKEQSNDRK